MSVVLFQCAFYFYCLPVATVSFRLAPFHFLSLSGPFTFHLVQLPPLSGTGLCLLSGRRGKDVMGLQQPPSMPHHWPQKWRTKKQDGNKQLLLQELHPCNLAKRSAWVDSVQAPPPQCPACGLPRSLRPPWWKRGLEIECPHPPWISSSRWRSIFVKRS